MDGSHGASPPAPSAAVAEAPDGYLSSPALKRRVGAVMLFAGALSCWGVLLAPDPDPSDHAGLAIMGGVLAAAGLGSVLERDPPPWAYFLMTLYGLVSISAIVAIARPISGTPFFFLWPMLYAAAFLTRRQIAVAFGVFFVSYAVALSAFTKPEARAMLYFDTVVSVALVTVTVRLGRERIDDLVARLHVSATRDSVTGLLNRRAFDAALARELERARRAALPVSVAVFDLDHFKQVNDRLGHAAGDAALAGFGAILAREARTTDVVARMGGEEFGVVLFGAGSDEARAFALRVARTLEAQTADDDIPLTVSAGVATSTDPDATASDLLLPADRALYAAKEAGRRRVAVSGGDIAAVAA